MFGSFGRLFAGALNGIRGGLARDGGKTNVGRDALGGAVDALQAGEDPERILARPPAKGSVKVRPVYTGRGKP